MIGMNDVRKGKVITFESEPYLVTQANFLRKQQRRPVMKTILKHLRTGKTKEHSFQQSDKIEEANITKKPMQYLYAAGEMFAFMDQQTYEQVELSAEVVGEVAKFLLEGQTIDLVLFEENPLTVDMPIKITRKVISSPDAIRGDTSTNVFKEVIVEGNLKVGAPLFIKEGESIIIDTRSGEYVERA